MSLPWGELRALLANSVTSHRVVCKVQDLKVTRVIWLGGNKYTPVALWGV
jgi:hypothetical protein